MSARYVTRPTGYIADDCTFDGNTEPRTLAVIEDDHAPVKTGLIDASGNELYRVRERRSVGFFRLGENGR